MTDTASANGFEGQLRHVDPLVVIGGVEMLASLGWCEINQDKINLFAAATSTSTSAASDNCCCGSPPISRSSKAQRPPPAGDPASGGERMLFRAWDGETRPWSVGELRPHFPDSPGGPDGSGPPGPLTAGRHVTTGKCRTVHKPPIHKPPRIRKREASRKVGCTWLPRTAS